jgi:hypothetical protein
MVGYIKMDLNELRRVEQCGLDLSNRIVAVDWLY